MKKTDLQIALDHIDNLTRYFIDSSNLAKCSEEARAFSQAIRKKLMNTPETPYDETVQLPPGKYWIGDLCYVIQDDEKWYEVCDLIKHDQGRDLARKVYTLKDGTKFMFCSTAYGDGLYYDQFKNDYGVDAGLIGIIALKDIDNHPQNDISLGSVFTFDDPVSCGYFNNGTLKFGNVNKIVSIETGDTQDEDEEEEDDQY